MLEDDTLVYGPEVRFDHRLYAPTLTETACFNCGKFHGMASCEFPIYLSRCYRCLVISFDGTGHTSPCAPVNTISGLCKDIFARMPLPLFKLRLKKNDSCLHYLDMDIGQFVNMDDGQMLLSSATDGLFSFKKSNDFHTLTYEACSLKRLSFVIAVFSDKGYWRLRYRGVLSTVHGLLLFKLRSTLQKVNGRFTLPPECSLNTTIVLGIRPKLEAVKLEFRIYANEDGIIDQRLFNGYEGSAMVIDALEDRNYQIDDEINGEMPQIKRRFDHKLQEEEVSKPVRSFHSQRYN